MFINFLLFILLQIFDSEGSFLSSFGSNGEGNGQFNAPTGVAIDSQDNIIVADWGNCRIQVINCSQIHCNQREESI